MRFLFIVQGEGRGHMTQAISMRDILVANGHEVVEVLVGKSEQRQIPAFFFEKIGAPVHTYLSPNFEMTKNNKGIKVYQSIWTNMLHTGRYFKSVAFIKNKIKETRADVVINFYEMLGGATWMLYRPKVKYICVGHQFLLLHPNFKFPKGKRIQIFMLNFLTRITGFKADKYLCLSFDEMPDIPQKKLYVVPPLLRQEVLSLTPGKGDYILGYMLNAGYSEEIIRWHQTCSNTKAHFFWDKKDAPEDWEVEANLWFHRISDTKFMHYMKDCQGYASTAGFESICEAMYLRKPVLMVPTAGHIEQKCNSVDGVRAGAGVTSDNFDLDKLIQYIPSFDADDQTFPNWAKRAPQRFIELLTK